MVYEGGNPEAGYRFERTATTVVFAGWGIWPDDVAQACAADTVRAFTNLPQGWTLLLDFERMQLQRPHNEHVLGNALRTAMSGGVSAIRVATINAIVKLQVRRLAGGQANIAFFETRSAAVAAGPAWASAAHSLETLIGGRNRGS
ncbi:MAG: hypothetical protein WKG00_23595 [Polyangiaceae bacterium]